MPYISLVNPTFKWRPNLPPKPSVKGHTREPYLSRANLSASRLYTRISGGSPPPDTYPDIHTYVCMHVCMRACMYVCLHACMHVCMYVLCMYLHMHRYVAVCISEPEPQEISRTLGPKTRPAPSMKCVPGGALGCSLTRCDSAPFYLWPPLGR